MAERQIRCVNKQPRTDTHHGITHVGGAGFKLTRNQAVQAIKVSGDSFYTLVQGKRVEVSVVEEVGGSYLRTYADGYYNDNLLALPECVG